MEENKQRRRDTDWDAVHRDYRTGKFTDRELAAKYKLTHTAIGKKRREGGWQKDLSEIIRQETEAAVLNAIAAKETARQEVIQKAARDSDLSEEQVSKVVSRDADNSFQEVSKVVKTAAAVNLRVIEGQHTRLEALRDLFVSGANAARRLLDDPDLKSAQAGVQAMATAIGAGKVITELENKVHKLDKEETGDSSFEAALRALHG